MSAKAPTEGNKFMSPGQAAEAIGVNPKMVVKWCKAGVLPHHKIPATHLTEGRKRIMISPEDVLSFSLMLGDSHEAVKNFLYGNGWFEQDAPMPICLPMRTIEVARLFGVSEASVRAWRRLGLLEGYQLPSTRDGSPGDWRFTVYNVVEFANKHNLPLRQIVRSLGLASANVKDEEKGSLTVTLVEDEILKIGSDIEIRATTTGGSRVKVNIKAPRGVPVSRERV